MSSVFSRIVSRAKPSPTAPPSLVDASNRAGHKLTKPDEAFLKELDGRLRHRDRPAVAVLGGPRSAWLPRALDEAHPRARVQHFDATSIGRSQLHAHLAGNGPFDVIVDDTRRGRGRARLLRDVFFHLRPGGALVIRNFRAKPQGGVPGTPNEDVSALVSRLVALKAQEPPEVAESVESMKDERTQVQRDEQQLASAIGRVVVDAQHVLLTNRVRAFAKVREDEMDTILELRAPRSGRVLESRPPLEFASRCTLRQNAKERGRAMPTTYQVPAVSLREYYDVVCAPGQVVVQDDLLLPDTYRHNQRKRLRNLYTEELSPLSATPLVDVSHPEALAGTYFYLDSEFRGHFGHAMTEVLSRLWAWPQAKEANPALKAVMALNKGREIAGFEKAIFAAAGIDPDDLVLVRGPVRIEKLIAATPMLSMPEYVHPDIAATWDVVGKELASLAPARDYPTRVFCSRRIDKRPCHNAAEVESLFSSHGFEVIYPEDYPLAEQAMIFRQAEVIAGFAGSGLFTLCLTGAPKRVLMISSELYIARNEYLIASVLGHEIDLVTCKADSSGPGHVTHSGFTFDFDREGAYLQDVLTSL